MRTVSDLFGEGWFKLFNVFNLYAMSSIIMVIEILLLNSIKRPYVGDYEESRGLR